MAIAAFWLTILVWVSTCDWANIDAQRHRFKYARWNSIVVFPFAAAFLLLFIIPWFMVSYPLLFLAYAIPSFLYVRHRNSQLLPHEQVLTWDHIRFLVAVRLNDVWPTGEVSRITYGLQNLAMRDSKEYPTPLEPGKKYKIKIKLDDIAWRVPKGHRLRVSWPPRPTWSPKTSSPAP